MKITPQELNERLKWPLNDKLDWAIYKFLEYFITYKGHVYLSFSGGKDSQILDYIITQIFAGRWKSKVEKWIWEIVAELQWDHKLYNYDSIIIKKIWAVPIRVFCDTGLEFPELRKHVKTFSGVIWLKPKMKFPDVIKNIGVAVGTKMIATKIRRLKSYLLNPSDKNNATKTLYLTGIKRDGTKSNGTGIPKFWLRLLDAPFKTSDQCCDIFKKEPCTGIKKKRAGFLLPLLL